MLKSMLYITGLLLLCLQATAFAITMTTVGCNVTKACFQHPGGCEPGVDCELFLSYEEYGEAHKFEMLGSRNVTYGQGWVSICFSDDRKMGEDSCMMCVNDEGDTSLLFTYNAMKMNTVRESSGYFAPGTQISVDDGVISCSFTRVTMDDEQRDEAFFDLNNPYYILIGSGPVRSGVRLIHEKHPFATHHKVDFSSTEQMSAEETKDSGEEHSHEDDTGQVLADDASSALRVQTLTICIISSIAMALSS
ncbi:putative ferric-chelate reductase 1 [Ptychodera flava]|uniref:putative ferric-chelate reductase 1 n=1 Tax=Ptychodera flava TaxID=63121 RepID=UPI003969FCC6